MATGGHVLQTRQFETADRRTLRAEFVGDFDRVVLAQLGSPNAGLLYERWIDDAVARGLTLITYDRPGYRGTSARSGRSVADCAADVRALSAEFGFSRCAVWGLSGGGPHALACAACLDELVVAVATMGSPAPFYAPGLDFLAGVAPQSRDDFVRFWTDRAGWVRGSEEQCEALLAMTADEFVEQWSAGAAPADHAALRDTFGDWLYRAIHAGLTPDIAGWIDDDIANFHSPWGFDPTSITVPVKLWHSRDDTYVPVAHAEWFAAHIPDALTAITDHGGHLSVAAQRIGDVHEWLAERL